MKVSELSFQKASTWIKRNARPLEAALWEYKFENGSATRVMKYLSAFQNKDGGFGHGIEPDCWLPHSSPLATWAAGRILIEIKVDSSDMMVQSLISYLTSTPQIEPGMWPSVLPENNKFPHAPWWEWQEGVQRKWMFNPSAELAAILILWSNDKSKASHLGWKSLEKAVYHLMNSTEMDMHEIKNYQMLYKLMKINENHFNKRMKCTLDKVLEQIICLVEKCIDRDVSSWSKGYTALPLNFIDSPDDPFCSKLGDLVEENLFFYTKQITNEGIWDISWEWEDYPDEFAVARNYWKGILAIERYSKIKSFCWLE